MKKTINLILSFCLVAICIVFNSCNAETKTENTSLIEPIKIAEKANTTTFILVRHAEKSKASNDPELTEEGLERAEKLATLLSETSLNKIYSTNYKRTIQTATPTANKQNLTIVNYEALEHDKLIEDILENNKEGKVLVVGHSNTIPNFLNTLTNTSDYPELSEDAYDNLYIVHTKSKGDSEVINLKF